MAHLALILLLHFSQAAPADNCYRSQFARNCGMFHDIALVTETDHRETLPAYARRKGLAVSDVENNFRATGIINCMGHTGTAQLMGKNNVLVTVGHAFIRKDCSLSPVEKCFFKLNDDPGATKYELDPGSLKTGGCPGVDANKDWATIKIANDSTKGFPSVTPYDYPRTDIKLTENQAIVSVSARHNNFKVGDKYPKTIEECFIRDINYRPTQPLLTDCNTGGWSSGSAQFIVDQASGKTMIGAISVFESTDGVPRSGYNRDNNFGVSVPLAGKFLESLKENLK